MGSLEVYPDLLVSESGSKTLTGGASAVAVLSDLSDSSYITAGGSTVPGYYGLYRLGPITSIPAGSVITRVQMRMRYTHFVTLNGSYEKWVPQTVLVGRTTGATHAMLGFTAPESVPGFSAATSPVQVWTGPNRSQTWDGKKYLHALLQITSTRLYAQLVVSRNWPYSLSRIYSLSVVVHYSERPTVDLTAPTGTVVVSRPTFVWSYSDPEGDPQAAWRSKAYDQATTLEAGFSADDAAFEPAYDSGDMFSAEATHTAARSLGGNGAYVAYQRTATADQAGVRPWSAWSTEAFTLAVPGPVAPTLTAAYDAGSNSILVTAQGKDNLLTYELSSFEPSTPYTPTWVLGSNTTVARSTAQATHGVASMQVTRTSSTGTAQVVMHASQWGMPATTGVSYQGRASFRANTTGRSCRVGIGFLNATGTLIGSVAYGSNVTDNSSGWVEATASAAAPANALWARLYVEVLSATASESHYVDKMGLFNGTVTSWNRGGFTVEGRATELQRSLDAGVTWEVVPESAYSEDVTTGLVVFPDYEAPSGATATYRARVEAPNEDGDALLGDWSSTASASMPAFTSWWLRDLSDPALSMPLHVAAVSESEPKPGTLDYPLGSTAGVMSHDGVKKGTLSLRVFLLDQDAYQRFRALIATGRTLLLQDTLGHQWYVQSLNGITYERLIAQPLPTEVTPTRHAHQVEVDFVSVERPVERTLLSG